MIDFSTLKGLTIPEGVVIKIESGGVVLWELSGNVASDVVSLEVEKIVSNTYANSTTYSNEEFILLDIYPKTNGTVSITYGGLTKTITDTNGAAEPSAQKVFFGTFNGVSDEVTTPASGTLTIEGDYRGFGTSTFNTAKGSTNRCRCITAVTNLGAVEIIPANAFQGCSSLTSVTIPGSIASISNYAFSSCDSLQNVIMHDGVTSIGNFAFQFCESLTSVTIPDSVTSIGSYALSNCPSLTSITIPDSVTSIDAAAFYLASGNTRTVTMLSSIPATLVTHTVFDELGTNHIVVPAGSGDAYKTAEYWSEYADYITEASA